MEAQYKKELDEKEGRIAEMQAEVERLEEQIKQKDLDHAELEEAIKKEREEHIAQIEKQNEEVEALKMELSKSNDDLEQSQAVCAEVKKRLREQQKALSDKEKIAENIRKGPRLQLDAARANTGWCHVTTDGELVNSPPATRHTDRGSLQRYLGTCSSTPIPHPYASNVTPHTPRYWETHSKVGVVGTGKLILEMGVGEEQQVDSETNLCQQVRSWCVIVLSCGLHWGKICTKVYQRRGQWRCYTNTMSANVGTQATLHYGIVLDVGRERLGFIDLDREVVLAKCNVKVIRPLLPMFSVGRSDAYTVNMKVISGVDITMTDNKKSLIYDALTQEI